MLVVGSLFISDVKGIVFFGCWCEVDVNCFLGVYCCWWILIFCDLGFIWFREWVFSIFVVDFLVKVEEEVYCYVEGVEILVGYEVEDDVWLGFDLRLRFVFCIFGDLV